MKYLTHILTAFLLAAAGVTAAAQDTNDAASTAVTNTSTAANGTDFSSFEVIGRKNIFDQSRTGARPRGVARRQPRVERLILEGIGGGQGDAEAYIGGSGASSDRMLKVGDHVAGFELSKITPDCVKLTNATNTFVLDLETRRSLRREDDGPWQGSSDQAEPVNISTNTADETASAPGAADASHPGESAIERKLRLRREQEEK